MAKRGQGLFVDICMRLREEFGPVDGARAVRVICEAAQRELVYVHAGPPEEIVAPALRDAVTRGTTLEQAAAALGISRRTAYRYQRKWRVVP